jgi:hypothetical protein
LIKISLVLAISNNEQMKEQFNQLINQTNESRLKKFYNLSELQELTGMSLRSLKYRMLTVKIKYEGVTNLLTKKEKQWQIHYSLITEFLPKYKTKNRTIYSFQWESLATWNPLNRYDIAYHVEVINQIKHRIPNNTIAYTVELDSRNVNHTHIISDAKQADLEQAINEVFQMLLGKQMKKEVRVEVEPIYDKYRAIEYIRKAPLASGIITTSKQK